MSALTLSDLRTVLDLVYALNAAEPTDAPTEVLAALARLVGADVASYTRVDHHATQLLTAVVTPEEQALSRSANFHAVFDQHPGHAAYRSGRLRLGEATALSDLAEPAVLRRLPLYVDFYAPRGTRDQLLCVTSVDHRHGSTLTFNRSRPGFIDRDREIAELISPHWAQAMDRRARLAALTTGAAGPYRRPDPLDLASSGLSALTRAERAVVDQLATGLTNREIARAMGISPRTVQKHLENAYRKLGTANRTSLIALLHRTGSRP
jgi:DNA-binding CsgD family transcriptional regulator